MQGTRAMTHLERPRAMVAEVKKYGGKKAQLVDIIHKSCTSSVGSYIIKVRSFISFIHYFQGFVHPIWFLAGFLPTLLVTLRHYVMFSLLIPGYTGVASGTTAG